MCRGTELAAIGTKDCHAFRSGSKSGRTTATGVDTRASVTGAICDELEGVDGVRSESAQQVSACP